MNRSAALILLVLLLPSLPGAEDGEPEAGFFAPSFLVWEGGDRSLAQTVAWLVASGNPTMLDVQLNGNNVAPVAFVSGTYWEAVQAVCAAYNLYVLPGASHRPDEENTASSGQLVAPMLGPAELALLPGKTLGGVADPADGHAVGVERLRQDPVALRAFLDRNIQVANRRRGRDVTKEPAQAPAARYLADGAWLMAVGDAGIWSVREARRTQSEARLSCQFRLEPRFTAEEVGACLLTWDRATAADGTALSFQPPGATQPRTDLQRQAAVLQIARAAREGGVLSPLITTRLYGVDAYATGFGLVGRLKIRYRFRFGTRIELRPGEQRAVPVRGQPLTITLRADPPAVVLRYPATARWLDGIVVNIGLPAGGLVPVTATTELTEDGDHLREVLVGAALQDTVYRVYLAADPAERSTTVPFGLFLELP